MSASNDEKLWAALSHILSLTGAQLLAPLIIYLVKKNRSAFITDHARESLNFQITVFILSIICVVLIFVLIGILMIWALGIADLVLVIVAAVRVNEGKLYRYPFNFRLIK